MFHTFLYENWAVGTGGWMNYLFVYDTQSNQISLSFVAATGNSCTEGGSKQSQWAISSIERGKNNPLRLSFLVLLLQPCPARYRKCYPAVENEVPVSCSGVNSDCIASSDWSDMILNVFIHTQCVCVCFCAHAQIILWFYDGHLQQFC